MMFVCARTQIRAHAQSSIEGEEAGGVGGRTRLPFVVECYRKEFERRPFHPTAYLGVSEQNCTQLHAHMDLNLTQIHMDLST